MVLTTPVDAAMKRKFISLITDTPNILQEAKQLMQQHMVEQFPLSMQTELLLT